MTPAPDAAAPLAARPPLPVPPSLDDAPEAQAEAAASQWAKILRVGLLVLVGGAVGYVGGGWLADLLAGGEAAADVAGAATAAEDGGSGIGGLVGIVLGVAGGAVVMLFVLAAHEAGHLLGGWLVGFRFVLFVVGPLKVERTGDGRLAVGRNRSLALAGGLAASVPADVGADVDAGDLRRRFAVQVAGGPATSLALGLLGLGAWAAVGATLGWPEGRVGTVAQAACVLTGAGSLLIAAVTMLPMRTSGFYTDGLRLWRLWRGGPSALRDDAVQALTSLSLGGVRPRDWPDALVAKALGDGDAGVRADGSLFAYLARLHASQHALDEGRTEAAWDHLAEALRGYDTLPALMQHGLALHAAYAEAALRGDAGAARTWRHAVTDDAPFVDASACHLADAAVALAEDRPDAARTSIAEARAALPHALDRGAAKLATDLLDGLEARLPRAAATA